MGLTARQRICHGVRSAVRRSLLLAALLLLTAACGTAFGVGHTASTIAAGPHVTAVASPPPRPTSTAGSPVMATPSTIVAAPSPLAPLTDVTLSDAWFVDAARGWVVGQRCDPSASPIPAVSPTCSGFVEHTADGGRGWTAQSLGDPRLIPRAVQFADSDHGWLAATTAQTCGAGPCATVLYATADGGRHWEAIFHTGPNTPSILVNGRPVMARSIALTTLVLTSTQAVWAFGTACTGADQAGCRPVLLATPNGGGFSQITLPALPPAVHAGLSHPTAADGWIAVGAGEPGTTSRILATHDGGRTWQDLPDPAPGDFWQQVFFRSATEGWLLSGGEPGAGQQLKTLFHTTDGGRTWSRVAGPSFAATSYASGLGLPTSGYVGQLVFSTAADGWISSPRGGLLHTDDGGRGWHRVPNVDCADLSCGSLGFAGPTVGWVVSPRGVWLTTDGGRDWTPLAVPGVDSFP